MTARLKESPIQSIHRGMKKKKKCLQTTPKQLAKTACKTAWQTAGTAREKNNQAKYATLPLNTDASATSLPAMTFFFPLLKPVRVARLNGIPCPT